MTEEKNTMDCLSDEDGQYCLTAGDWTTGQCCSIASLTAGTPSDKCTAQPVDENIAFCGRKTTIPGKFLRNFLIPADPTYCPTTDIHIEVTTANSGDNYIQREHPFKLEVPTLDAENWSCKYHITSEAAIADAADDESKGYIYLEAEQYGFDENVVVIV